VVLKIEWKQSAKKDFIAIVEYISQRNLLAAETFIEVVENTSFVTRQEAVVIIFTKKARKVARPS
jgi:hypothetical protein